MDHKEIGHENVNWIHLAPDRDQWQALVRTPMDVRFEVFTAVKMSMLFCIGL
jgi:hypothetical protein